MKLPLKNSANLIIEAREKEAEKYAFEIWKLQYPNMNEKNFKTFEEFYNEIKSKNNQIDDRDNDEIMNELLKIQDLFESGGERDRAI